MTDETQDYAGLVKQLWAIDARTGYTLEPTIPGKAATAITTLTAQRDAAMAAHKLFCADWDIRKRLTTAEAERDAAIEREARLRSDVAAIWRSGVGDAITAVDRIRPRRNMRGKALQNAAAELDRKLQKIHDARMAFAPTSYQEAADAGKMLLEAALSDSIAPNSGEGE